MCGLLVAMASLVAEHRLGHVDFSSCSSHALEHRLNNCGTRGMWDLSGSGIELVTSALADGFLSAVPPGKSMGMKCNKSRFPSMEAR